jgi:CDP-diacylglycerol---glycerol-3-phosphate 3-phosphatidyltransferase
MSDEPRSPTGSRPHRNDVDAVPPATASMGPSVWNVANLLTVVRILLVPLFGWLLLADAGRSSVLRWTAFGCFAAAMLTDRVDGDLARSRGLVTDVGKVLDPIADKALVTMALVGLSTLGEVPWWVTVVVLVREWGITAMRFWVIRYVVLAAGRGGKLKTLVQSVGIGLFVSPRWTLPLPEVWDAVAGIALAAAVVITVGTGVDYVIQALRLRRTGDRAAGRRARAARREPVARDRDPG